MNFVWWDLTDRPLRIAPTIQPSIMNMTNESKPDFFEDEPDHDQTSFQGFNLEQVLLRGIYGYGFQKPSQLQTKCLPPILRGRDTIIQAQSGTGKTAAHVIGTLHHINTAKPEIQAIILAPVRKLCCGIERVLHQLGEYKGVQSLVIIGGTTMRETRQKLKTNVYHVIVATCGRLLDSIQKNFLDVSKVKILVIDQADELLARGFKDQLNEILGFIPNTAQTILASATMPPQALEMANSFMTSPAKVLVESPELTLEGIKQYYVDVGKQQWKQECLIELFQAMELTQAIVFANQRGTVVTLVNHLKNSGFQVVGVHADMDMAQRQYATREYRIGSARILVCTELQRDVTNCYCTIINYDMPARREAYVYRVGRSGRYGRKGLVINFMLASEAATLNDLRQFYNTNIQQLPMDLSGLY